MSCQPAAAADHVWGRSVKQSANWGGPVRVEERLVAIGPLLKERLWESTAVRELRGQAAELARALVDDLCA